MQSQEDVFRCFEGLTLYAAERDICMESGDTDARIRRIRRLISGMSELYGLPELPEVYDKRISAARGCSASEIAGISQQKDAVWGLVCYAKDLAPGPDDSRSMMLEIQKLFDEMYAYLPWNPWGSGPNGARDVMELLLRTATAQQNIVFTRVQGVICCGPEHQITIETEPQIEAGSRMKL